MKENDEKPTTIYDHISNGGVEALIEFKIKDKFQNEICDGCIAKDSTMMCIKIGCENALRAYLNQEWKG